MVGSVAVVCRGGAGVVLHKLCFSLWFSCGSPRTCPALLLLSGFLSLDAFRILNLRSSFEKSYHRLIRIGIQNLPPRYRAKKEGTHPARQTKDTVDQQKSSPNEVRKNETCFSLLVRTSPRIYFVTESDRGGRAPPREERGNEVSARRIGDIRAA